MQTIKFKLRPGARRKYINWHLCAARCTMMRNQFAAANNEIAALFSALVFCVCACEWAIWGCVGSERLTNNVSFFQLNCHFYIMCNQVSSSYTLICQSTASRFCHTQKAVGFVTRWNWCNYCGSILAKSIVELLFHLSGSFLHLIDNHWILKFWNILMTFIRMLSFE